MQITRRIVQALFRSNHIVNLLSDIPCNVILTLENDAEEAKNFIDELENGKVPTIIKDLPKEVIGAFSDVVGMFASLPTQIIDDAKAVVTDAVNIFNDIESGAIVSDLEKVPGIIVSDVTRDWGDIVHAATCIFVKCPVATTAAHTCGSTQAITAQTSFPSSLPSRSSTIHPTSPPLSNIPSPTQTRPKTSSSPVQLSESTSGSSLTPAINAAGDFKTDRAILRLNIFQLNIFQLFWFLGLGSLGVIFLLL